MIKTMCIGGMTCPHCYARVEQALVVAAGRISQELGFQVVF